LNAVPVSLAQCDGRFLLSAAVDQDAIVANILNAVFNTQVSGFICVVHDVGWLVCRMLKLAIPMTSPFEAIVKIT
jgi:hypothetical protein